MAMWELPRRDDRDQIRVTPDNPGLLNLGHNIRRTNRELNRNGLLSTARIHRSLKTTSLL